MNKVKIKSISPEQFKSIYNGTLKIQNKTIFVVGIIKKDCDNCNNLMTFLHNTIEKLDDESVRLCALLQDPADKEHLLLKRVLNKKELKNHGAVVSFVIGGGIRENMSIFDPTGAETNKELEQKIKDCIYEGMS